MTNFITAVTDALKGVFQAVLDCFGGLGELVFEIGEGAITGITPFGYILALIVGVPLATWIVGKGITLIKSIKAGR